MATITLFANRVNNMPELFNTARNSVSSFREELESLRLSALGIDSSVCDLDATISSLRTSTDTQEAKITALESVKGDAEVFASETVTIDEAAADAITSSKDDFYDTYDYMKPDSEKGFWERVGECFEAIGEWCKEHWVEICIGLVFIVVGAVLTALTGGAFLAALLAGLKFALVSALISGGINMALYVGGTMLGGGKLNFGDAMTAFGDGLASGFMWGGIFAGVSMGISAGFRFAASKGVTTGPSANFRLGRKTYPDTLNPDGGGTIWNFAQSRRAPGFRFDVDIRTLNGGFLPNYLHFHLPFVGTNSLPFLGIVRGHIPVALYGSILSGVGNSNSSGYSDFKKWQREKWRQIFGN